MKNTRENVMALLKQMEENARNIVNEENKDLLKDYVGMNIY